MRRRGFTYVELIVVMLAIGIVTQLALAALSPAYDESKVSAAAREVAATLEYAKQTAAGTSNGTRVTFTPASGRYKVERIIPQVSLTGSETTLDKGGVETTSGTLMAFPPDPTRSYDISLVTDGRFGAVTMPSAVFGAGSVVTFDGYGTPSSSGIVTLRLNNISKTVSLAATSGQITISP